MPKLKITLRKSTIGYDKKQRDTVRSLGIKKMHHSVEHEDSPVVRGMIHHVRHLLEVETVNE
jgi:large subunit ribosomal protein L30